MMGQWKESVGCRWIVILLIDAIARERDREMQTIAVKGLINLLASLKNIQFIFSQSIDMKRIKEAVPFEGEGEIGWCFWKQGDIAKAIIDICECLLPIDRMIVNGERDWILLIMRHKGVLEKILHMLWGIEYQREMNLIIHREIVNEEKRENEWILESQSFLMEYRSLKQLISHTPSLFPSISPSFFMSHSQDEVLAIIEQAKTSSQSEDGMNGSWL